MKYKLINITTKQETLCDKITIDGFDYYVSDKEIKPNDYFYWYDSDGDSKYIWQCHSLTSDTHLHVKYNNNEFPFPDGDWNKCYAKRVIATNNPNIDIPQALDEVAELSYNHYKSNKHYTTRDAHHFGIGYNEAKETHPFSEDDVREIFKIAQMQKNYGDYKPYTFEESMQIWQEQQPKKVYYNE